MGGVPDREGGYRLRGTDSVGVHKVLGGVSLSGHTALSCYHPTGISFIIFLSCTCRYFCLDSFSLHFMLSEFGEEFMILTRFKTRLDFLEFIN